MTKSQNNGQVGDSKAPPLQPEERGLRTASDQATHIHGDSAEQISKIKLLESVSAAVKAKNPPDKVATCKQSLWFSFFFDGTGNNLYADQAASKHSNVAKLFRTHVANDPVNGIYAIYLQGVGTYFPEIGDDGGSNLGLGTGSMGQERLDYALKKFDNYMEPHLNRAKASKSAAIEEINVAVFGFSRGAALARAFLNVILEERCIKNKEKWVFKSGQWPMRLRFMGLFDTVASVGLPMSSNTTSKVGAMMSSVEYMMEDRLASYIKTRPQELAFAEGAVPGADPAPGKYDGHSSWGGQLEIDHAVEEVRHFIAAHEIRNSFPVDSISVFRSETIRKPAHFHETVYPGVHSDVGGSYAPGEGARSDLRPEGLGLVPLTHMYKYAVNRGVPLLPAISWANGNKDDFEISKDLVSCFNYYMKQIGAGSTIGGIVNKHMSLYFAWRFRSIKMKLAGNKEEAVRISKQRDIFSRDERRIDEEIAGLEKRESRAAEELNSLISRRAAQTHNTLGSPSVRPDSEISYHEVQLARERKQVARHAVLTAKARKLAQPNMDQLQKMLSLYDKQLINDVKAIREACSPKQVFGSSVVYKRMKDLRPHYRNLVEAYENEFEKNQGLKDQVVINFFDNYVHDSLAGFAGDATLPSDPRVVYLGDDKKYEYAYHLGEDSAEKVRSIG
jgi:hypothetical protein